MIIDFHTHTFPDRIAAGAVNKLKHNSHTVPFSDGTVEGLIRTEQKAGIDLAVVLPVATSPHQVESINRSACENNEKYADRGILSFAAIHPDYENYRKELARCQEMGFKGIKIHPVYQGVDLDDIRYLRIMDRAAELGLIVVTHAGYDVGFPDAVHCSPEMVRHAAEEVGSFRFVAAHMGGWREWEKVPALLADTGVFLDTSFSTGSLHTLPEEDYYRPEDLPMLNADGFMKLFRAFGPERILFGTDSPWSDPEESLSFIRGLPVSESERDKILGKNAGRLLSESGRPLPGPDGQTEEQGRPEQQDTKRE